MTSTRKLDADVVIIGYGALLFGYIALADYLAHQIIRTSMVLALVFLVIKSVEYSGELGHGLRPATSNFVGLYFVMTFLHAVHVAGGALVTGYLAGPGAGMHHHHHGRLVGKAETVALYWYFVDVVWLLMFVTLYLL